MPTAVQFRRGTTAQNNSFTGAIGELSIDTDLDVVRVHDGSTAGGFSLVGATSTQTLTNKTLNSVVLTGSLTASASTGTSGQYLQSTGTGVQWVSLSSSSINNGTSNIAILGPGSSITANVNGTIITTTSSTGLAVTGVVNASGNILSTGAIHNALTVNGVITSTQATGTAPFTVSSTTVVTNLNADLWDGNHFGTYLNQAVLTSSSPTFVGITASGYINTTGNISASVVNAGTVNGTHTGSGSSLTGIVTSAVAGTGISVSGATGAVTITNSGVTSIVAGSGISISGGTGAVTITASGSYSNINLLSYLVSGVAGSIIPSVNNSYNLGSSTYAWATIYGTSTSAKYADLAEKYTSDQDYAPGTVVVFGGSEEVTQSNQSHDPAIAGVVSTNPAHLMNDSISGVAVALQGRVPCRVLGPIRKGDRVVASEHAGIAQKLNMMHYQPGCIIGKALENIEDSSIQTIEVVVGRV